MAVRSLTFSAALFLSTFPVFTIFVAMTVGQPAVESTTRKYWVYVGTYTGKDSKGIYAYRFDSESGTMAAIGLAVEIENPSFLAVHPSGRYLYAANELDRFDGKPGGAVTAFSIDSTTGRLHLLNQVPSKGAGPTHILLDHTGKYAFVANYSGGSVVVFAIGEDGRIRKATAFIQHKGSSIDPNRHSGPHPHSVTISNDNRFALVPDLGLDKVLIYKFEESTGVLAPNNPAFLRTRLGAGPRHIAFHPNGRFVYVVNEMQSTVEAFFYDEEAGVLNTVQTLSTVPARFSGHNLAAEICVDAEGRFLYVSNRGHNSIAVFAIAEGDGSLSQIQDVTTDGKTPRNFAIDPTGKWLLVANQDSNNVALFEVDRNTRQLASTHRVIETPTPTCIAFAASQN